MEEFPVIHTSFWDAILAVPLTLLLTQLLKVFFHIPKVYVPTVATIIGLLISIFYSHKHDLSAGIFMGFFYGSAAVGTYSALKTSILAYRSSNKNIG